MSQSATPSGDQASKGAWKKADSNPRLIYRIPLTRQPTPTAPMSTDWRPYQTKFFKRGLPLSGCATCGCDSRWETKNTWCLPPQVVRLLYIRTESGKGRFLLNLQRGLRVNVIQAGQYIIILTCNDELSRLGSGYVGVTLRSPRYTGLEMFWFHSCLFRYSFSDFLIVPEGVNRPPYLAVCKSEEL